MGQGSKAFCVYYSIAVRRLPILPAFQTDLPPPAQSLVYLAMMTLGWVYSTSQTCDNKCPMAILVTTAGAAAGLDYSLCNCEVVVNNFSYVLGTDGFPSPGANPPITFTPRQRYDNIFALWEAGKYCFICASASSVTILQPCKQYEFCQVAGILGFRAASIPQAEDQVAGPIPAYAQCNSQTVVNGTVIPYASILTSPTVLNRALVTQLIMGLATLFLIQMLCAMVCAYAYSLFRSKYGSDWGKLTSEEKNCGFCAKLLPTLTRSANVVTLFILIIVIVVFFQQHVCEFDRLASGFPSAFYPTVYAYLIAMTAVWLIFCVLGGCFHRCYPRDTSFYAPKFPEEPNEPCAKKAACGAAGCLTSFGP